MVQREAVDQTQTPEILQAEIQMTYDKVFGNEEAFNRYFFATLDKTPHDLQVRLGVFIKRLSEEPSERFWLMRTRYRDTEFPATSIHKLDRHADSNQILALNGYTQAQLDSWRDEQPDQMEQFLQMVEALVRAKLQLPTPEGEGQPKVIYQYPSIGLSPEAVDEVLKVVLPKDVQIRTNQYSGGKQFDVEASSVSFNVHVLNHSVFGDYIEITFPDEAVQIDKSIQAEYARYYKTEVAPIIIKNAIRSLDPGTVSQSIADSVKSGSVFERMFLTPGELHHANKGKKSEKAQYYARGDCVDIDFKYAQKLGLLPEDMYWHEFTFPGGWFSSTEELWHSLFNSPYPGEVRINESDTTSMAVQVRSNEVSATYKRVFTNIGSNEHEQKEFISRAQDIINGYRFFTPNDFSTFTLPEGYQPIAVSQQGDFAICFREMETGVELCFQIPNETIVDQIDRLHASNEDSMRSLQSRNLELEKQRLIYQRNDS